MKTAILIRKGTLNEVSAERREYLGYTVSAKQKMFQCTECNQYVALNRQGYFQHLKKNNATPECEKRVKEFAGSSIYQRVGLPLRLEIDMTNQYALAIGFYAIGKELLKKSAENHINILIGNSQQGRSKRINIDTSHFRSEDTTFIRTDFLPMMESNYSILVSESLYSSQIRKKWSNFAEGFYTNGAIFTSFDEGSKKIKQGDPIHTEETYLMAANRRTNCLSQLAKCHGVKSKEIGELKIGIYSFAIVELLFEDKGNEIYFEEFRSFILESFNVNFLHKESTLIPVWPPLICDFQNSYKLITDSKEIFCLTQSTESKPSVCELDQINRSSSILFCDINTKQILISFLDEKRAFSVNSRKNGIVTIDRRNDVTPGYLQFLSIVGEDEYKVNQKYESIPKKGMLSVQTNFKAQLYRITSQHIAFKMVIKSDKGINLDGVSSGDKIVLKSRALEIGNIVFELLLETGSNDSVDCISDAQLFFKLKKARGINTTIPYSLVKTILHLRKYPLSILWIKSNIYDGTLPIEAIRIIETMKERL